PEFSRALHYILVEQSPHLREKLKERLPEHVAAGKCEVVQSIDSLLPILSPNEGDKSGAPSHSDALIVFANEFFDALPVEVIDHRGTVRVGVDNGRFVEKFVEP